MLNPFSTARSRTILAALVSWTLAGVTTTARTNPNEQLKTWRLMPLIFLLPSYPRSPCCGPDTTLCESRSPVVGSEVWPWDGRSRRVILHAGDQYQREAGFTLLSAPDNGSD